MFHGRNNGKKLMAVRIVRHTFEIIHLLTGEVNKNSSLIFSVVFFVFCLVESTSSTR
jgi:small subunit ribosomal protein S5e